MLLWHATDSTFLPAEQLTQELAGVELREVELHPLEKEVAPYALARYPRQVWDAAGWPWVMTSIHHGMNRDDWSARNWLRHIAYLYPLTPERARLLDDLRAVRHWSGLGRDPYRGRPARQ